jgi:hypothetical protein
MSAVAFSMFRGDTAAIGLSFVQKESPSQAYDLSGLTLTITANTEQNPTDATNEIWSVAMTVTSAVGGVAEFELNATQANMTPGTYYFDVESVNGASKIKTLYKGAFTVKQDINKA